MAICRCAGAAEPMAWTGKHPGRDAADDGGKDRRLGAVSHTDAPKQCLQADLDRAFIKFQPLCNDAIGQALVQ